MFKICFFVPENDVEMVKQALFDAGAGRIGNYDSCSWQALGTGQFRPLEQSDPTIGQLGETETVAEYKVELVCDESHIKDAIQALRDKHPYEEPAYDVFRLESF